MTVRLAAAFLALSVTSAVAQSPDAPEPPPGANSWSLSIHTTGGFTGRGVGSVTISSDGQMGCGPAPCATPGVATRLEPFGNAIASAVVRAAWGPQPLSTLCSDCIRTTIVIKRREGDVVRIYRASWDDSQPVASELRDLRRLALDLRSARSAR